MSLKRAADTIISQDIVKGTRKAYASKVKYMVKYLRNSDEYKQLVKSDADDPEYDSWVDVPLPLDAIKSLFARIATDPALPKEERPGRRRRRLSRDAAESDGEVDVEDSTLAEGVQESGTMEEFEGELREEISELEEQLGVRLLNANMKTISGNGLRGYKSAFKKYYESRNVAFETTRKISDTKGLTLDAWLNKFCHGYDRIVTLKKEKGIMSGKEDVY